MKIEQGNQYATQYAGIGSNISSTKNVLYKNPVGESDDKGQQFVQQQSNPTSFALFERTNSSLISPMVKSSEENVTNDGPIAKYEEMLSDNGIPLDKNTMEMLKKHDEIHESRIKEINNALEKLGINGEITASRTETVPQNYTICYIETTDGRKMVVTQFENGEYMVGETSLDREELFRSWDIFRDMNGFNNGKLSVDKLKVFFEEFLNIKP